MSIMTFTRRKPRVEYYGLDVFDARSREWVHTGYLPYAQANKEAQRIAKQGGRVHLYHATGYSAAIAI